MLNNREIRVLIVDETERYSDAIKECASSGHKSYSLSFQCVDNETSAVELLKDWEPSIVLLDAHVPLLDSFDVLERYMAELVPVIVTSTEHSSAIEASALSRGAIAYFPKTENPDEIETLLSSIERYSINFETSH